MLIALTRAVSPNIGRCELTYMDRAPIDAIRAASEHDAYRAALERMGADVLCLPADPDLPDCAFIEDTALVLDEVAVVASMAKPSRAPETRRIEPLLSTQREVARIEPSGALEGGDVFVVDRTVYAGLSSRTNEAGVEQLRAIVEPLGYEVRMVPVIGCLHLTTGASHAGGGVILVNPSWINADAFSGRDVVRVDEREPWAANTLHINGRTLIGEGFPRTRDALESRGVRTDAVDISELMKAEAGLTCMSLIFEGDPSALRAAGDDASPIVRASRARPPSSASR